jgi:cbb3-type cytochrome oxidase maturation protein
MESLYLLIPFSVLLVFVIGGIFWWSLKSGQMEDLEGPAYRILMDDDLPAPEDGRSASAKEAPAATVRDKLEA